MSSDAVWLDVLPKMDGFVGDLVKKSTGAAREAGQKSGKAYSDTFAGAAAGASDAAVRELEAAQAKSAGLIKKYTAQVIQAEDSKKLAAAGALQAQIRYTEAVDKYGESSDQAAVAMGRLEVAQSRAAQAEAKFQDAKKALVSEQKNQLETTEQLTKANKDLTQEVTPAPGLWGKLRDKVGDAATSFKDATGGVAGLVGKMAAAAGGVALMRSAFNGAIEGETATATLTARLAATPEQAQKYGDAAGSLYSQAYGDSMTDVSNSVDAVVSSLGGMRDASQKDIEKITGYAMNLASAFDVDVAGAANTAGILMREGLAKDATQAFDLMTGAMTNVPQAMRGEILPVMDEYSKHFAALGIDGETSLGMIVAAAGDGAIGMDKMGDALKEFTIRGTDMSKSTTAVYKSLGLDSKQMTDMLLAGGADANTAMAMIVEGLSSIQDPGDQAAASLALFGTPLEDLGTDQIPNFLGMIDPMGDAFDSTAGSADKLGSTLGGTTAASIESTKRSFMEMLTDGLAPMLGPLQSFFNWAKDTPGVLTAVGVTLGIVALAWAAVTLAASPWLALGVGIALVIGGVVLAIMNWGKVVDWMGVVWGGFMIWLTGVVNNFGDWWNELWAGVGQFFTQKWTELMRAGRDIWAGFQSWIGERGEALSDWWNGLWAGVGQFFSDKWRGLTTAGRDLWTGFNAWLTGKGQELKDWWNGLWAGVGQFFSDKWTGFLQSGRDIWSGFQGWINEKLNGFKAFWGGIWTGVSTFVQDKWENGVAKPLRNVWNNILSPMFDTIQKVVKGDFPGAFESAKKAIQGIWNGLRNIAAKPINFIISTVYNNGLRKAFNFVAQAIPGVNQLEELQTIPEYAKGGHHQGGWAIVGEQGPELVNFEQPGRIYTAAQTAAALAQSQDLTRSQMEAAAGDSPRDAVLPMGGNFGEEFGNFLRDTGQNIGKAAQDVGQWIRGGLADAAGLILNPIKDSLPVVIPGAGLMSIGRGVASKAITGTLDWLRGDDEKTAAAGNAVWTGSVGMFHRPSRGPITSMFGPRWGTVHAGIDIAGGGPTYAALDGVVQRVGWNAIPGRTGIGILLNHARDLWTYYGHNPVGGPRVSVGQQVKAGQHIGYQGATGNVTGTHLHFEVQTGNVGHAVDPMRWGVFDQGGVIPPGATTVFNHTGQNEQILNPQSIRDARALVENAQANGDGSGDTYVDVRIDARDLEGLKAVEDLVKHAKQRGRRKTVKDLEGVS